MISIPKFLYKKNRYDHIEAIIEYWKNNTIKNKEYRSYRLKKDFWSFEYKSQKNLQKRSNREI